MAQYNALNVQLPNSQLNKLKFGIKNGTWVTSKSSSNVVGDSNDETNFPHKFLLTNTQVSRSVKLLHMFLHKIRQSGEYLGRPLGPLPKTGLLLMEIVLRTLAESVLILIKTISTIKNKAKEHVDSSVWY